jgi:hypothetical protein
VLQVDADIEHENAPREGARATYHSHLLQIRDDLPPTLLDPVSRNVLGTVPVDAGDESSE